MKYMHSKNKIYFTIMIERNAYNTAVFHTWGIEIKYILISVGFQPFRKIS